MATASERTLRLTEKAFLQQIRDLARVFGWLCYHTHDSRRSESGFPDLLLVHPPSVIFAELKNNVGRVSPAQRVWIEAIGQCPAVECYLWRPQDWPAIVERLKAR